MEALNGLVRFFQNGGFFMYLILLVTSVGLAIAVERFLYLSRASASSRKVWDDVVPLVQRGNIDQAMKLASESKAAMGNMLAYGLARVKNRAEHRDEIETAMEEGLMEVIPNLEKRTHYLATLANVAMLLGLLGTVSGLIDAFGAVAHAEPSQKAELLSAAIAVGMNATAFGLGAAIPMMLIYSFLQSKTTALVDSLEMAAVKFLNMLDTANKSGKGA
ncbi:MAG: MotA/TolQ/ExbB proton channel family protein [Gammaproteobacteria bacterium]|nr:MotA/TolQ/ExbB proton channel family protein [Gammaproteobacteria bacterium]